jgi:ribonuclease R
MSKKHNKSRRNNNFKQGFSKKKKRSTKHSTDSTEFSAQSTEHRAQGTQHEAYLLGTVDMKRTGKAYVIPDDKTGDIKIAPNNTGKALNRDIVKVFLFPKRKDKKPEGQIVEIIKRAKTTFVGIVSISEHFAFLVCDNPSMQVDIYIPLSNLNGAKDGDKAIAEMTDWPENSKNPFGKIINVLGRPGDNNVEMQSILAEFEFPLKFPDAVEADAAKIKLRIPKCETDKRRDFRQETTFTIDPVDAKDFDDALSVKKLGNGNYEIGVHIADVSHYVKENTILEDEAYKRAPRFTLLTGLYPCFRKSCRTGFALYGRTRKSFASRQYLK